MFRTATSKITLLSEQIKFFQCRLQRNIQGQPSRLITTVPGECLSRKSPEDSFVASDHITFEKVANSFLLYENFITETEHLSLLKEAESYLRHLRYESSHWDEVSHHTTN